MNTKEFQIDELLKSEQKPLTAMDIINRLYPGKLQSYINSTINKMVTNGFLHRENVRPYTVRLIDENGTTFEQNRAETTPPDDCSITTVVLTDRSKHLRIKFNDFWNAFFGMGYHCLICLLRSALMHIHLRMS